MFTSLKFSVVAANLALGLLWTAHRISKAVGVGLCCCQMTDDICREVTSEHRETTLESGLCSFIVPTYYYTYKAVASKPIG